MSNPVYASAAEQALRHGEQHQKNDKKADGKSILSVLLLAAANGTTLHVQTEGEDEERAADAVVKLIEQRFGEEVSDAVY